MHSVLYKGHYRDIPLSIDSRITYNYMYASYLRSVGWTVSTNGSDITILLSVVAVHM